MVEQQPQFETSKPFPGAIGDDPGVFHTDDNVQQHLDFFFSFYFLCTANTLGRSDGQERSKRLNELNGRLRGLLV